METLSDIKFLGSNNFAYFPQLCLDYYDLDAVKNKANCIYFGSKFSSPADGFSPENVGNLFKNKIYALADFRIYSRNYSEEGTPVGLIFDMSDIDASKRTGNDGEPVTIKLRSISYVYHAWVEHSGQTGSGGSYDDGFDLNSDDDNLTFYSTSKLNKCGSTSGDMACVTLKFRKQVRWVLCSQPLELSEETYAFEFCTECSSGSGSESSPSASASV